MLVVRNKARGEACDATSVITGESEKERERPRSFSATATLIGPLISHLLYLLLPLYHVSSWSLLSCNMSSGRNITGDHTDKDETDFVAGDFQPWIALPLILSVFLLLYPLSLFLYLFPHFFIFICFFLPYFILPFFPSLLHSSFLCLFASLFLFISCFQ
jgi:hypothetical protein